ncbi:hypothetical protein [Lysobacter sp. A3-1-A15]|uniref:hypothetical protein n=1 Tax=Novilysobacter viscosus TaxID=3098602 RepID=UPI002EDB547D
MSDTQPHDSRADASTTRKGHGARYLFVFLLGLVIGVLGVVMLMRSLESRKDWSDHYPDAAMRMMQAHSARMGEAIEANRCAATDILPHLQALRVVSNDLEPAFPDLRDDARFTEHARLLRATLDDALGSPPLNCESATATSENIGEACKACHQDFRG